MPEHPGPPGPTPVTSGEWVTLDGVTYRRVVLCFIFRSVRGSRDVLLGLKRTGFGTGRVVAIGGKVDGAESDLDAAVREVREETALELPPSSVRTAGRIRWAFPAQPDWNMAASLFTADVGDVEPVPCEEIEPRWYPVGSIPWQAMWQDAPHWLPRLLEGAMIDARIVMAEDNEAVAEAVLS